MKRIAVDEYFIFGEAWFFLALARLMLLVLPFRKIAPLLGQVNAEDSRDVHMHKFVVLKKIKVAIIRASRFSPWRTKCFEQAIAGKLMVKRRKINSTLYLGVFKDVSDTLNAHAWLKTGNFVVTGGPDNSKYTIVSRFNS